MRPGNQIASANIGITAPNYKHPVKTPSAMQTTVVVVVYVQSLGDSPRSSIRPQEICTLGFPRHAASRVRLPPLLRSVIRV